MSLTLHVATRIYGAVRGFPPFEDKTGATYFTKVYPYPSAPLAYIPTNPLTIWPLPNGTLIGNTYVYSVLELPSQGLNQESIKLATDTTATNLASSAT